MKIPQQRLVFAVLRQAILRWVFPLIAGSDLQELLQRVLLNDGSRHILQIGNPWCRDQELGQTQLKLN